MAVSQRKQAALEITVFQYILGFFRPSGPQIDSHHDIRSGFLCPVGKFIQTELVAFNHRPCQIHLGRTHVFRTYAVFPMIAGHKIAAGITYNRNLQLPHQIQTILPHPLLIGKGAVFLIDSLVYGSSQMLNKRTENPFVHLNGTTERSEERRTVTVLT